MATDGHSNAEIAVQSARAASNGAASRLTATGLACWRGSRLLFKELDFEVEAGQIVWVRGQNGRGKTSLLRLAAGLSAPEQGQILREGNFARRVPDDAPRCVFIGHANALKEDLTVSEALGFLLHIHGRPCELSAVHAALERLGLHSRRNAMVRTLSQGQRRRVALARLAIETDASLWILDEPFDALDADGVERVNGLMREHVQRGGGVLLSSHLEPSIPMLPVSEIDLGRYC